LETYRPKLGPVNFELVLPINLAKKIGAPFPGPPFFFDLDILNWSFEPLLN
jgi:hypothetical protein